MLKVAIETSYTDKYNWNDEFWARFIMQNLFKKNDIELVRVSMNKLNKKKEFIEYNILTKYGINKTIRKTYKPDIIRSRRWIWTYYKYSQLEETYKITPSKKVSITSNDKYESYLFLKKYQPKTCLLSTFFSKNWRNLLAEKIVIKPIRANWWKGIELITTTELLKKKKRFLWLDELYIVQEFKDFSKWYPWIVDWNHDIRLMFAWKKIVETTLRIPQKWNFKSNLWSWWTQSILTKKSLPKELLILSKSIYKKMELEWDDIMSMDFAYCAIEKKRYLIEINASPGTRYYQTDKIELKKICEWLIVFFKTLK